uniref:ubiquitinyl hydrolase 1 n=1 Tax=Equus caballus TaxID=9796 RepID=A0A9L0RFJ4_HORSE
MREPLVRGSREAGGELRTACPRPQEHSRARPPCTTNGSAWSCAPSTPSTTSCSSSSSPRRLPTRSARAPAPARAPSSPRRSLGRQSLLQSLSQLALPQVLGLILNLPSPVSLGLLSLPLRRRHWVALRQVDGVYYNLDSKLRAPEALGDEDGVRTFLAAALAQGLCEVLLVVTKEVEEKGGWLRTD